VYQVFGDATLRHMARQYPQDEAGFLAVPGVGQQKLADYGEVFIGEVVQWLVEHEAMPFEAGSAGADASPSSASSSHSYGNEVDEELGGSAEESLRLRQEGLEVEVIAERRGLKERTIHQHLCQAITCGALEPDPRAYYSAEDEVLLREAADKVGLQSLGALRTATGDRFDYITLGYFRAIEGALPSD